MRGLCQVWLGWGADGEGKAPGACGQDYLHAEFTARLRSMGGCTLEAAEQNVPSRRRIDDVRELDGVDAKGLAHLKSLRHACHADAQDQVVAELGDLACTHVATVHNILSHGGCEDGLKARAYFQRGT